MLLCMHKIKLYFGETQFTMCFYVTMSSYVVDYFFLNYHNLQTRVRDRIILILNNKSNHFVNLINRHASWRKRSFIS
jgi:cytochrome c oxidase subunit IV